LFFKTRTNYWINDYLNKVCYIEKVLSECKLEGAPRQGKFSIGLANPSPDAIREMEAKGRDWELGALDQLLSLKTTLIKNMGLDYVIFDTSPGLTYSSINAIVAADVVLVVTTLDKSDVIGTRQMLLEIYKTFNKKTRIILNRIPIERISSTSNNQIALRLKENDLPPVSIIPCFCDLPSATGEGVFASERQEHPFIEKLQEIATTLESLSAS
jgi:septum site-determining protein MinD